MRFLVVVSEFYRGLKPDQELRVVVHDAEIDIQAYVRKGNKFLGYKRNPRKLAQLQPLPLCYLSSWFFTYDYQAKGHARFTGGHVMAFNWEVIQHYLKEAGFRNIEKKKYADCRPEFARCDFERYKDCSIYVEAIK